MSDISMLALSSLQCFDTVGRVTGLLCHKKSIPKGSPRVGPVAVSKWVNV